MYGGGADNLSTFSVPILSGNPKQLAFALSLV